MWRCSDCGHEYDNNTHNCGECKKPRDLSTYSTQNMEACQRLMDEKCSDAVDSEEPDAFSLYGQREQSDIRLVLIGKTGSGKSAVGNTILARKEFKSQTSASSVTSKCKLGENRMNGRRYFVVDTPGLFDTKLPQGEVTREIIRCIHMSIPGPHVFLLVLRVDRFTREEIDTFENIFDIFGEKMSSFAVILFTRLDDLELEDRTIEEFVETSSDILKNFIRTCKGRFIAFNNRGSEEQKATHVIRLKEIIDDIIQNNSGKYYTNELYKEAEAELQKKIKEVERLKALEKQKEIEKIESKFKGQMNEIKAENQVLERDIQNQKEVNKKIQIEKKQRQDQIEKLQNEMEKATKNHKKEVFEARQEEKRKADVELKKLQGQEEKNRQETIQMQQKVDETERRLQFLENEKQKLLDDQNSRFDANLQTTINYLVDSNNSRIEGLERMIQKNEEDSARNRAENEKLLSALESRNEELKQMRLENKSTHEMYISQMIKNAEIFKIQLDGMREENKRSEENRAAEMKKIQDEIAKKLEESNKKDNSDQTETNSCNIQ